MLLANKRNKWMCVFFASVLLTISTAVSAVTPTKQQIEQFKKLSPAQQRVIAKQYGFDVNALNATSTPVTDQTTVDVPAPREEKNVEETFETQYSPKKTLQRFGLDLFSGQPSTFAPTNNTPVPANYVLGPGDSLIVNIFGKDEQTHEVMVDREGAITIPGIEPIYVTGSDYAETKQLLVSKIKSQFVGANATVSMGKLRTIRVFVLGEAYQPGAYAISALSTITHALIVSGGVTDIGSLRAVQLKRSGQVVATLDLYDLLIKGDTSNDLILQAGDVVFVPTLSKTVEISGEVRRPAVYELKENESYADLLKLAGGTKSKAALNTVSVERFTERQMKRVFNFDFRKRSSDLKRLPLDGDEVFVDGASEQFAQSITLIGAIERPGIMQWRSGARVTDYLSAIQGVFLPIADLNYGLVVRQQKNKPDLDILQFSPQSAVLEPNSDDNLPLKPNDKVLIFSRFEAKSAEKRMLEKYAMTQEQFDLANKEQLWEEYKEKQFFDFIEKRNASELSDAEQMATDASFADRSLVRLNTEEKSKRPNTYYSMFSRHRLLAPVILMLREQAGMGASVRLVEVDGRVKTPGVYPLPVDGRLSDLIVAAGGLDESAYLEHAELTRTTSSTSSTDVEHINVNLRGVLNHEPQQDILLVSKDRVNVLPIPNWQDNITVSLSGEVKFPGKYTIRRGESLAQVVERAGGFTSFADLEAAIFTRATLRARERQQLQKLTDDLKREMAAKSFEKENTLTTTNSYSDMKLLLADLAKIDAVGRLIIDLPDIIAGVNGTDVELQNGDELVVPSKRQSINVIGEVYVSTSHMYEPSVTLQEYIERSGGFKQRAADESVYIIKSNGSVVIPRSGSWFAVEESMQLEAGDTIVVPLDTEYVDNISLWNSATQIVYQLAVTVAAIGRL